MRKIIYFLLPLLLVSCLGEKEMKKSVEEQANELGDYMRKGLLERYLDRMAYFVYANPEERKALKQQLQEKIDFMNLRGDKMESVESHLYSDIYENEGYYQCMVRQTVFITNAGTTFNTETYLLAISEDGEEWKFVDATNLTSKLVKAVFPEMHPDLKIEKRIGSDK